MDINQTTLVWRHAQKSDIGRLAKFSRPDSGIVRFGMLVEIDLSSEDFRYINENYCSFPECMVQDVVAEKPKN